MIKFIGHMISLVFALIIVVLVLAFIGFVFFLITAALTSPYWIVVLVIIIAMGIV